ncbi:MAG: PQQ-binding-like beta-propeller repeat protein [Vicinamibacterales bacterium]
MSAGHVSVSLRTAAALLVGSVATTACGAPPTPVPTTSGRAVEWPVSTGDAAATRWSTADDITPQTVSGLRAAWSWRTGEAPIPDRTGADPLEPGRFQATPVMRDGTLYLSTPFNRVAALDAATGLEHWTFDPGATDYGPVGDDRGGFVHRGVALWDGEGGRRVFLASRWWLIALDAATGQPVPSFGDAGRVDLTAHLRWPVNRLHLGNTSPPVVWRDVVIVGSAVADRLIYERDPPGDVQAFDARTGALRWRWDPVPPPDSPDRRTWSGDSADVTGHANVWAAMSLDAARGLVYLPVSTPSNDWYGGRRRGDNLYAQSVVCLDAATGRQVWHQQLVHHGLWDYDPAMPPLLATVHHDGVDVDALFVAGKTGFLYAFDRVTGTPLWPLEERPAPASTVPGEAASPTQPHPVRPAPFAPQGFTRDDLIDFTPDLHAQAVATIDGLRLGPLFTPPSLEGTVVRPGWIGGGGWGNATFDPDRRLLFVKATNLPVLARLVADDAAGYRLDPSIAHDPARALMLRLPAWRTWLFAWHPAVDLPIVKPPWGTLTAIDVDTGDTRWQVVLGDTPAVRDHPALRGLDLPPLGVAGAPGGAATRGGLVFITGGGDTLYAIDARDGRVRWAQPLGREAYSNPMTYRLGGRQYVVVATGHGADAELVAFVLPG